MKYAFERQLNSFTFIAPPKKNSYILVNRSSFGLYVLAVN